MKQTAEKTGTIPKNRIEAMERLGLKFDGTQYAYRDINFHWTDLLTMSDAAFEKAIKGAAKRMAELSLEPETHISLVEENLPQESKLTQVLEFIQALKAVKPKTKDETIHGIHALSAIASAEKQLKEALYGFLDNRCGDCEEHESSDGLKVIKVQNQMKKYKSTKEVKEAEKDLEAAKEALQAAKDKAGFTLTEGASYWKAVR